ncbi:MAG: LptF/LptG family permease, partial [Pseudomonadota bacterium]
ELQARTRRPEDVSFWQLSKVAERASQSGKNPLPFVTQRNALLAQPALLAAMVLLAATMSLSLARFGVNWRAIAGGVVAGFVLYVVVRLVLTFGSNGLVPPAFAAWGPALVATLIASTIILHREDG